ncbi:MAG: pyridoxal phosphate-dependent aminotransferase [Gemmataceae bacterium]
MHIADRCRQFEVSGIRKVFELGRSLVNPVNLSIGQPHFEVPEPIRTAIKTAVDSHKNGYTVTQGIAPLRERILADLRRQFPAGADERDVIITSGTSGGLVLAMLATINPGDEVLVPDPYFVSYPNLIKLAGGVTVPISTYPDFRIDPDRVAAAITPRTKMLMLCSPANPTGAIIPPATMQALAELCTRRGILLLSDEIYAEFHYDGPRRSPLEFDPSCLVLEGFGKSYGFTGWRLGFAHGPKAIIAEMMKLQQFTFVCAPSIVQEAGLAALDFDVSGIVADYRQKRDRLVAGLKGYFEFQIPGGAFYLFPQAPFGTGTEFVTRAIRENLLMIPGGTFSQEDTHFRISYAASDAVLDRGIELLQKLAKAGPD